MSHADSREPDSRLAHVSGIVLCTGFQDLVFGEHSLGERVAALLALVVHDVSWVGAEPPPGAAGHASQRSSGLNLVGRTPEAALREALEEVSEGEVLVVSADRPLLTPDLLIGLAGRPDAPAVVPRDHRGAHLLCARYDAATVLRALDEDRPDPESSDLLGAVGVEWLEQDALSPLDPVGSALVQVDAPGALERLVAEHPGSQRGLWFGSPGMGLSERATPTNVGH